MGKALFVCLMILSAKTFASLLYIPNSLDTKRASLVVVLHGCLQTAESMAAGTGWNAIAEKNNIVVLYPQIRENSNPLSCWNWFLPENQGATMGQLKDVFTEIKNLKKNLKIETSPTFVTGISSGAATAAGLLACFPNEFKAGAIHSGPAYASAKTFIDADKVMKDGPPTPTSSSDFPCQPKKFTGAILVIHGTEDKVVNPLHADRTISDFLPGALPVKFLEKTENGLSYSVTNYIEGGKIRGRTLIVKDLGHAWSGFNLNLKHADLLAPGEKYPTVLPFFSDKGPSATNWMWEFFSVFR